MARAESTPQLEEALQRESDVRRAHAARARRGGRASAPGYLGVPLDEAPDVEEQNLDDHGEEGGDGRSGSRPRTRERTAPRNPSQGGGSRPTKKKNSSGKSSAGKQKQAAGGVRGSKTGAAAKRAKPERKAGAAKQRSASATKPKPGRAAQAAKRGTGRAAKKAASVAKEGRGAARKKARKEMRHVAGALARKATMMAARGAARAARRAGEAGAEIVAEHVRALPIQRSVDVAVPVEIAWEQWQQFEHLPEGAGRVTGVERDGNTLSGRLDGVARGDWEAEVLDEREHESFAWRSTEGSDSAGLVTFHPLAERLTRIELELDIKPLHLLEAASLATHIADRRVETQLRSFKAEAELLSPDIYEELLSDTGSGEEDDDQQ